MRFIGLFLIVLLFSVAVLPQEEESADTSPASDAVAEEVPVITDKEAFASAIAVNDAFEKIKAITAFLVDYPDSELREKARESLSSARATGADIRLRAGQKEDGIRLFKLAVSEAPRPLSDDLFSKVLVNIPTNLFLLGERNAAFDIAELLENISADKPRQLLRLATFYIGIKYATGARRLSEKAILLDPEETLAHQTLGIAQRLGFDLSGAESSYGRALVLDPDSLAIRQNLGDIKRALGKPGEAEALYSEILSREPADSLARTGLILSLYDQNKRKEAEALLVEELNANPVNAFVMIGAANWYAANGEPQLAIDHTKVAVTIEESSVWAYLVMARGYMLQNKPQDAERSLLAASRFGASPALSYELALARNSIGFYREAAEELQKHFRLENGKLVTELDGRIGAEAETFADLVRLEQKSYLNSGESRFDEESDRKLKELLEFEDKLSRSEATDENLSESADAFANGTDAMKAFRQVYASKRLLDVGRLPEKAVQMAQDAATGVEISVEKSESSAAVLAEELYERRKAAARSGRVVIVPEIEKPTLLRIMRGRIEELAARSLIAEENYAGAELRLRRAVSVLPQESAWWRSSMWRLGDVYEKLGEDQKALDSYASSYVAGEPLLDRRAKLETLYSKVNGSMDGFEDLVSGKTETTADPASLFVKTTSGAKSSNDPAPRDSDTGSNREIGAINTGDAASPPVEATGTDRQQEAVAAVVVTKNTLPEDLDLTVAAAGKGESAAQLTPVETDTIPGLRPVKPAAVPATSSQPADNIPKEIQETPKQGADNANTDPSLTAATDTPALETSGPVETEPVEETSKVVPETAKDDTAESSLVPPTVIRDDAAVVDTVNAAKPDPVDIADSVLSETPKDGVADSDTIPPHLAATESAIVETVDGATAEAAKNTGEVIAETRTDDPASTDTVLPPPALSIETPAIEKTEAAKDTGEMIPETRTDAAASNDNVPPPPALLTDTAEVKKIDEASAGAANASAEDTPEAPAADLNAISESAGKPLKVDEESPAVVKNQQTTESPSVGELQLEPVPTADLQTELAARKVTDLQTESPAGLNNAGNGADVQAALIDLGATRPRFVPADKIRLLPPEQKDPNACEVVSSQESISIIANGGSLAIVVGLKNYDKAYVLRAISKAPGDIAITYEPDIGSLDGLAFFVIRSISDKTGEFEVQFETPCGTKSVEVNVY